MIRSYVVRPPPKSDNLGVDLIMHDALSMYKRKGADVVDLSQPRVSQEAAIRTYGGTGLTAVWS